jgi:DNA-binding CsgD family transcriptional regulator/DNA-binding winged helix-turn-helix (wHTH) protein
MKAQADVRTTPNVTRRWPVRLLLAGEEDELTSDLVHRTFDGSRRVLIARSASLLGALERIQTERADLVLLSQYFRDEEVAAFLSNARRAGFEGLVLRVASMKAFALNSYGTGLRDRSLQFLRVSRVKDDPSAPSFTSRQRAVLKCVSEGWTNGQVARHLQCSEAAIKATLQQIFKKLGVRKRSQVVRLSMERRLLGDPDSASRSSRRTDRVAPVLLSSKPGEKQSYHVGDFVIDVAMHRVWVRGIETHLTPSEFELLEVFAAHQSELVRSTILCEMFWRNPTAKQDSLRVLVRSLRTKIEGGKIPQYILTERNFGYRFNPTLPRSGAGI